MAAPLPDLVREAAHEAGELVPCAHCTARERRRAAVMGGSVPKSGAAGAGSSAALEALRARSESSYFAVKYMETVDRGPRPSHQRALAAFALLDELTVCVPREYADVLTRLASELRDAVFSDAMSASGVAPYFEKLPFFAVCSRIALEKVEYEHQLLAERDELVLQLQRGRASADALRAEVLSLRQLVKSRDERLEQMVASADRDAHAAALTAERQRDLLAIAQAAAVAAETEARDLRAALAEEAQAGAALRAKQAEWVEAGRAISDWLHGARASHVSVRGGGDSRLGSPRSGAPPRKSVAPAKMDAQAGGLVASSASKAGPLSVFSSWLLLHDELVQATALVGRLRRLRDAHVDEFDARRAAAAAASAAAGGPGVDANAERGMSPQAPAGQLRLAGGATFLRETHAIQRELAETEALVATLRAQLASSRVTRAAAIGRFWRSWARARAVARAAGGNPTAGAGLAPGTGPVGAGDGAPAGASALGPAPPAASADRSAAFARRAAVARVRDGTASALGGGGGSGETLRPKLGGGTADALHRAMLMSLARAAPVPSRFALAVELSRDGGATWAPLADEGEVACPQCGPGVSRCHHRGVSTTAVALSLDGATHMRVSRPTQMLALTQLATARDVRAGTQRVAAALPRSFARFMRAGYEGGLTTRALTLGELDDWLDALAAALVRAFGEPGAIPTAYEALVRVLEDTYGAQHVVGLRLLSVLVALCNAQDGASSSTPRYMLFVRVLEGAEPVATLVHWRLLLDAAHAQLAVTEFALVPLLESIYGATLTRDRVHSLAAAFRSGRFGATVAGIDAFLTELLASGAEPCCEEATAAVQRFDIFGHGTLGAREIGDLAESVLRDAPNASADVQRFVDAALRESGAGALALNVVARILAVQKLTVLLAQRAARVVE